MTGDRETRRAVVRAMRLAGFTWDEIDREFTKARREDRWRLALLRDAVEVSHG